MPFHLPRIGYTHDLAYHRHLTIGLSFLQSRDGSRRALAVPGLCQRTGEQINREPRAFRRYEARRTRGDSRMTPRTPPTRLPLSVFQYPFLNLWEIYRAYSTGGRIMKRPPMVIIFFMPRLVVVFD